MLTAQQEMLDWRGTGMSVMEMSHRGPEYTSIAEQAEADLRDLMGISDDYAVLFLQGGASSQFSMIPMNLLHGHTHADYLNTGAWSEKAITEAQRYTKVNVVADAKPSHYRTIPDIADWQLSDNPAWATGTKMSLASSARNKQAALASIVSTALLTMRSRSFSRDRVVPNALLTMQKVLK